MSKPPQATGRIGRRDLVALGLDRADPPMRAAARAQLLGYYFRRDEGVVESRFLQREPEPLDPFIDTNSKDAAKPQTSFFLSAGRFHSLMPERETSVEVPTPSVSPRWENRPKRAPEHIPLAAAGDLSLRIAALLSERVDGRKPDMQAWAGKLARLERAHPIPRRRVSRLPAALQIIVDRQLHLVPFWQDQTLLFEKSSEIFGDAELRVFVRESGAASLTDPFTGALAMPDPSDGPLLALSDLGALSGDEMFWRCLGEEFGMRGEVAAALMPCAPECLPEKIARLWRLAEWEPHSRAVDQHDFARRLMMFAAPAMRLEPGLLRQLRLRLLPKAGAAAEALVWNDPAIASRNAEGASFDIAERVRLRRAFIAKARMPEGEAQARAALEVIRAWREPLPEDIWFEEIADLPADIRAALLDPEDVAHALAFWEELRVATADGGEREIDIGWRSWLRRVGMRALEEGGLETPAFRDAVMAVMRHTPEKGPVPRPGVGPPPLQQVGVVRLLQHGGALIADARGDTAGSLLGLVRSDDGRVDLLPMPEGEKHSLPPLTTFRDPLPDGTPTPEMIALPTGSFLMGSPANEEERYDDEGPQHRVEIAEPFALAKYPVTFEEYDAFCKATDREKPGDEGWGRGRRPVINVSWEDAQAYCAWLSEQTGEAYRLPSEAEWEYACRAGTTTRYWWGDDWDVKRANGARDVGKTTEVGRYDPNPWGLHDTHGNVDEWCADHWRNNYEQPCTQQAFTANGESDRVIRGGSWSDTARDCRSAYRLRDAPDSRDNTLGFRPARGQASGAPAGSGGAAGGFGQARGAVSGANGERPGMAETPPPQGGGASGGAPPKPIRRRVMPGRLADPIPLSALPPGPFVIRTDRAELTIQRITRTELGWASGMGRDRFGLWADFTVEDIRQRLRWCPPGRFLMGSPEGEAGYVALKSAFESAKGREEPQTEITIGEGFWLFDTPVTQELYEAVTGQKNPSQFVSPTRPVETVNWNEARTFIAGINERFKQASDKGDGLQFTLPSESQWEYACRAGTTDATYAGPMEIFGERNAPILDDIAWYGGNSGKDFDLEEGYDSSRWGEKQYDHSKAGTMPVGLKRANPWGLHDMLGNVFEWCEDAWQGDHEGAALDGSPRPASQQDGESNRVIRGGSWGLTAWHCRSAYRSDGPPGDRSGFIGFRPARGQASGAPAVKQESAERSGLRSGEGSVAEPRPERSEGPPRQGRGVKSQSGKKSIDYREVLSAEDFAVYAKLRDLRKQLAERDGVPPYAVFTNEQLAAIVQGRVDNLTALKAIDGIGDARVEKYGLSVLTLLQGLSGKPQEPRDET